MEVLLYMMMAVSFIAIGSVIVLFATKNQKIESIIFLVVLAFGIITSIISAISSPSNYMTQKILSLSFGFLGLLGAYYFFMVSDKRQYGKILVSIGLFGSIFKLFFSRF